MANLAATVALVMFPLNYRLELRIPAERSNEKNP
jgi:hypothetical protein